MGYKILGKANEVKDQAETAVSNVVEDTSDVVSDVVDTTKDVATKVGKASYKMLGQAKDFMGDVVEEAKDFAGDAAKAQYNTTLKAKETFQALKSTPVATMLDDIFLPAMGRKITEKNFSPESTEILRQMALDNNLKAGDSMKIDYEDFNKYGAELSARFVSGTNEDTGSIIKKLSNLKPADEVKMTLGEAMLSVDEQGNIKVVDQYDFNSWVNYGAGKNSQGKYPKITADEFEKSDISFTEAVMDTLQNSPSDYQMMRNLAFLFGSRDYEGTERDTGRKVEINLGKVE